MKPGVKLYWIDAIVDNPDEVSAFYTEVAGLQREAVPERDGLLSYSLQDEKGDDLLGICAAAAFTNWPRGWLPYIEVEDYDASLQKVEKAGGEIVSHMGPITYSEGNDGVSPRIPRVDSSSCARCPRNNSSPNRDGGASGQCRRSPRRSGYINQIGGNR